MMARIAELLHLVNGLKEVRRAGWVRHGIADAESVADHSYGVATLALLLAGQAGVDRERVLALAIIHDIAETITGDITPFDAVTPAEKASGEWAAIDQLSSLWSTDELRRLFAEYRQNTSAEAQFVHDLDALEMASQAISYEQAGRLSRAAADSFLESASQHINGSVARQAFDALIRGRS